MRRLLVAAAAVIAFGTFGAFGGVAQAAPPLKPTFSKAAAFDVSKPLRDMTAINRTGFEFGDDDEEEGPEAPVGDTAHTTDGALQSAPVNASIPYPCSRSRGHPTRTTSTSSASASLRRTRTSTSAGLRSSR